MKTTICTDERIYLVKFAWSLTRGKFITNDLAGCIKANQPIDKGIEYIKTFEPSNCIGKSATSNFVVSFCSDFTSFSVYFTFGLAFSS